MVSLEDVLAAPDEARQFFDEAFRTSVFQIAFAPTNRFLKNPKRPFLGKFDWSNVPNTTPTEPLTFVLKIKKQLGEKILPGSRLELRKQSVSPTPPYKYFPKATLTSEYGFVAYPRNGEVTNEARRPKRTIYVLPGHLRFGSLHKSLIVYCDRVGAPWRNCSMRQVANDRLVSLSLRWAEKEFPEEKWTQLDKLMRDIAHYVMIDRQEEDFQ